MNASDRLIALDKAGRLNYLYASQPSGAASKRYVIVTRDGREHVVFAAEITRWLDAFESGGE